MAIFGNPFDALQDSLKDVKRSFSKNNYGDPVAHIGRNLVPEYQMAKFAGDKIFGDSKIGNFLNRASNFYGEDEVNKNISSDILDRYHIDFKKPGTAIGLISSGYGVGSALGGGGTGGLTAVDVGPTLSAVPEGFGSAQASGGAAGGAGAGAAGLDGSFDWKSLLSSGMGGIGGGQEQQSAQPRQVESIQPSSNGPNWGALLAQPQQPQQAQQAAQPASATPWTDRLMNNLNSPQAQLGLRILANNRGGASFGNVIGQSGIEQLQANAQAQQAQLQQKVMEAQLKKLEQPQTVDAPTSVREYEYAKQSGFKGSFEDWIARGGQNSLPSNVAEAIWYEKQSPEMRAIYDKQNGREQAPYYQWVQRVLPDGSTQQGSFNARTGRTTWDQGVVPPGKKAGVDAAASTAGKTQAEAAADLPRQEMNAEQAGKAIDDLLAAPGAPRIFGVQGALPIIPGSTRADAKAILDQIKGKTFLEAYNTLKGGGAITEIESTKAEKAIARLDQAQSWTSAEKALKDLKEVIDAGVKRARQKAGKEQEKGGNVIDYKDLP